MYNQFKKIYIYKSLQKYVFKENFYIFIIKYKPINKNI